MSKVKVSVIVPVFNVGEYLSTSLDSILNQTLEDIEIICINDGSTDDSLNILEYYAKKDKRENIYDCRTYRIIRNKRGAINEYTGFDLNSHRLVDGCFCCIHL